MGRIKWTITKNRFFWENTLCFLKFFFSIITHISITFRMCWSFIWGWFFLVGILKKSLKSDHFLEDFRKSSENTSEVGKLKYLKFYKIAKLWNYTSRTLNWSVIIGKTKFTNWYFWNFIILVVPLVSASISLTYLF